MGRPTSAARPHPYKSRQGGTTSQTGAAGRGPTYRLLSMNSNTMCRTSLSRMTSLSFTMLGWFNFFRLLISRSCMHSSHDVYFFFMIFTAYRSPVVCREEARERTRSGGLPGGITQFTTNPHRSPSARRHDTRCMTPVVVPAHHLPLSRTHPHWQQAHAPPCSPTTPTYAPAQRLSSSCYVPNAGRSATGYVACGRCGRAAHSARSMARHGRQGLRHGEHTHLLCDKVDEAIGAIPDTLVPEVPLHSDARRSSRRGTVPGVPRLWSVAVCLLRVAATCGWSGLVVLYRGGISLHPSRPWLEKPLADT